MNALPAIGSFIRPAGRFRYSVRVTKTFPDHADGPTVVGVRWGSDGRNAIDDGHKLPDHVLRLRALRPGCWRQVHWGHPYSGQEIYWVACELARPAQKDGQLSLFGGHA